MTRTNALRAVPTVPTEEPAPDLSYEWQDRQRIAARDWAAVHVAADKRSPLFIGNSNKRTWRQ